MYGICRHVLLNIFASNLFWWWNVPYHDEKVKTIKPGQLVICDVMISEESQPCLCSSCQANCWTYCIYVPNIKYKLRRRENSLFWEVNVECRKFTDCFLKIISNIPWRFNDQQEDFLRKSFYSISIFFFRRCTQYIHNHRKIYHITKYNHRGA